MINHGEAIYYIAEFQKIADGLTEELNIRITKITQRNYGKSTSYIPLVSLDADPDTYDIDDGYAFIPILDRDISILDVANRTLSMGGWRIVGRPWHLDDMDQTVYWVYVEPKVTGYE